METDGERLSPPDNQVIEADIGSPEPDRSMAPEASVDEVDHLLDEVEDALTRLDDGTYGECTSCGGPIDDARLSDDPTASACAGCLSPIDGRPNAPTTPY